MFDYRVLTFVLCHRGVIAPVFKGCYRFDLQCLSRNPFLHPYNKLGNSLEHKELHGLLLLFGCFVVLFHFVLILPLVSLHAIHFFLET